MPSLAVRRRDSRSLKGHRSPGRRFFFLFSFSHALPRLSLSLSLPSLLNCLANISARARQIPLFPVDFVLSGLAVKVLIIQQPVLSLALPPSPYFLLSGLFFFFFFFLSLSLLLPSLRSPPHQQPPPVVCVLSVFPVLSLMLRTSRLRGDATGGPRKARQPNAAETRSHTTISRRVSPN